MITRRSLLRTAPLLAAAKQLHAASQPLVDTHIHLFDPAKFPYHAQATYQPPAATLENYLPEAAAIGLAHSIIVHPEPYQDDHAYLEHCFRHEPRPGFFKGTCLFDPLKPDTPDRMQQLVAKWPGRIVALRIHAVNRNTETSGPIRNRPLNDPRVAATWRAAGKHGLAIQMHAIPMWAPAIHKLALANPHIPVVIDHLCRYGEGTAEEYEAVLKLGKLKNTYLKFSGLSYSSKAPTPHADLQDLIKRIYDAFSPQRIVWGGLGMTRAQFDKQKSAFDLLFGFASTSDRAAIAGANAVRLYKLKS